jgi:hypothetical protein
VPTKPPQIEQTWVLPFDSTSVQVDTLLPPEIRVVSGAFVFRPTPVTVSRSLGSLCSACTTSSTPVAKPAFTASVNTTIGTGADILGSTIAAGSTFRLTLSHNFSFDPLRPSASGTRGWVVLELRSGTTLVGRDSINGATTAWPALPQSLVRDVPLTTGATISSSAPLTVDVTLSSPAGDPVTMNTSQQLTLTAAPTVGISNVRVRVTSKSVAAVTVPLDVEQISDDVIGGVQSGGMIFNFTNPFGVSGSMTMTIAIPGQPSIVRTVTISSAATSTASVDFSADDLKRMLGERNVTLSISGTVSGPAAGVLVTPGQRMSIQTRLRTTIRIGG